MRRIRVVHITYDLYYFDPRVRRLADAAASAGYEVDVICLSQPGEKRREFRQAVSIYRLPMHRAVGRPLPIMLLYWIGFTILASLATAWRHVRRPYSVVVVHNMPDFLVFSAWLPKLLGAKVILDMQDVAPELITLKTSGFLRAPLRKLAAWQERASVGFADHIITVGWSIEDLLRRRGVPEEKFTSVRNSADPQLFPASRRCPPPSESADETHPFILMYHGTIAERSGVDTAIRALALARHAVPRLRLDIKARGECLPDLKQLAADLDVSEHVVFSDICPVDEVVNFVLHGDVGIIPYRSDPFTELLLPTKAYEFAWMHRPMIASDTCAIRSMFRPESLVLCDPADPRSFAEAIVDLYQHPEKRAYLVANAAIDYMPYRWERESERYQHLLASLAHVPVKEARSAPYFE